MPRLLYFRRSLPLLLVCCAVLWWGATPARADSFSFVGTVAGVSVNGSATLTGAAGSNSMTLSLTNNTIDIFTVAQAISGFEFKVVDSLGNPVNIDPISITSQSGRLITVAPQLGGGGVASDVGVNGSGADILHWGITDSPNYITALGFPGLGNPPDETILGAPSSGMTYGAVNGSITNNPGHPPFVMHTANFSLQIGQALPAGFRFQDLTMYFGTVAGNGLTTNECRDCNVHAPEPGSLVLLGTGLAGMALWARKRKS